MSLDKRLDVLVVVLAALVAIDVLVMLMVCLGGAS